MRKIVCLTLMAGFFLSSVAVADVKVTLSVDQTDMTLEDEATLTISIESDRSSSDPVFPPMAAFKAVPHGTSSSIQIINGNMNFKKEYTFELIPQNEGNFVIGPVSIFAGGQEYQSNTLEIRVSRDRYSRPPQTIPGPRTPPPTTAPPSTPGPTSAGEADRPYWIETSVSTNESLVSQQILFTFRFVTSVNVGAATLSLPEFEGFLSDEVVPEKKYYQEINGTRHVVSEKVVALFPLKAGTIEIGETLLEVDVQQKRDPSPFNDPFFGFGRPTMKRKNLRAAPISVTVEELPSPRPDNFSNLVGQFTLTAAMAEKEIKVGDSATLTIEISGTGNIKDAILPKSLDFGKMKVYNDKPTVEVVRKEHGISGKKTFKIALVPVTEGSFSVPKISLSYFDPDRRDYVPLDGDALSLNVLSSGEPSLGVVGPQPSGDEGKAGEAMQEDIATLHAKIRIASPFLQKSAGSPLFYGLLGFPPFLFLATFLIRLRRDRREKNLQAFREREAYGLLKKRLREVTRGSNGARPGEKILEAVKLYIGDRFHLYGAALTTEDIVSRLARAGVMRPATDKLRALLSELERAEYGGAKGEIPVSSWVAQTTQLFGEVEKRLKKGRSPSGEVARLIPFLFLIFSSQAFATPEDVSKKGAEAYYQNRLDEAEEVYTGLLKSGIVSGDLHYNLGNVAYREGKLGRAILHYERALRLLPRDTDLRANLFFVRKKIKGTAVSGKLWERVAEKVFLWSGALTLTEAFWVFNILSGLFWLAAWLALLSRKTALKKGAFIIGIVWIVFASSVWFKKTGEEEGRWAIVTSKEIEVHPTFLERDKTLQKIPEGSRLRLLAREEVSGERWLMVELTQGRRGWVEETGLEVL